MSRLLRLVPKDRSMTREQWKAADHWIRQVSRLIESSFDAASAFRIIDRVSIYGSAHLEISATDEGVEIIPLGH